MTGVPNETDYSTVVIKKLIIYLDIPILEVKL